MSSTISGQELRLHAKQCSVAPSRSDATVSIRQNTPDFIAADEWASFNSPDLNPLDCCIWDILQHNMVMVYEGRRLPFANVQDFKEAIKNK